MPRILAHKSGEIHHFDEPKFLYAYMDLFWSEATPIFTIFLCRMTRMVKIVTRPKTMVNFIFFPLAGKMVKIIFFPPAGNSGPSEQQNGGGITTIPPPRFALSVSSSGGLSAWRWACALPRCGNRNSRISRRIPKIRTRPQSETDSDFVGLVREAGVEPARPCEHWHLKPASLPIPPLAHIRRCFSARKILPHTFPRVNTFSNFFHLFLSGPRPRQNSG